MIKVKTVYRHMDMSIDSFNEKHKWCMDNLYHGGYYEPNHYIRYPWIEFTDEKEYMLFLLRWS